jgi:anthranilate synthase component II
MQIVIIDNYDSFVYNIVRYINDATSQKAAVMRNDKIDFALLEKADAIVLSPGPGIPEEAGELMKVIEQFHAEKPILGICLGHQAIGEYFGARLVQNEFPLHGKSTLINKVIDDKLFIGLPAKFEVGRYHSWSIENNSSVLEVTSQTDQNEVMSIKHASLPIYGLQFHPESILTPNGRQIIQNWIATIQLKTTAI